MGVNLGEEVGYTIRFDDKSNAQRTRIKFLTDGILLREMMSDPLLSRSANPAPNSSNLLPRPKLSAAPANSYSVIMVDEAHERSLYTDVLLGLLKKIQKRRKELRVRILSASQTLHTRHNPATAARLARAVRLLLLLIVLLLPPPLSSSPSPSPPPSPLSLPTLSPRLPPATPLLTRPIDSRLPLPRLLLRP